MIVDDISQYVSPHSTCERVCSNCFGIEQPYSFFINALSSLLILRRSLVANNESYQIDRRIFIFSIFLFELVHTLSHAIHYNHDVQEIAVHMCVYLMGFAMNAAFWSKTRGRMKVEQATAMIGNVVASSLFDLVIFLTLKGIYSIGTALSVLAVWMFHYVPYMTKIQGDKVIQLTIGVFILFIMFFIESRYCFYFLSVEFPYHAIVIEVWESLLIQLFSTFFD